MTREVFNVEGAPPAVGPYSHAVRTTGTLHFLSGQVPLKADGEMVTGSITDQTEQVFHNIKVVLGGLGLNLGNVVKSAVFLSSMDHFVEMNAVYATHFEAPFPARSTIAVKALPKNADVEIEVIAVG
ncbi:MAG: Rid family detoxifying hydrolase [bacterium]